MAARRFEPAPGIPTFHGPEEIGDAEKAAVLRVLDKKRLFRYLANGIDDSEAARLEAKYRELIGVRHALAVNGGTTALIAAIVGVGVGPGDEVIVPAYTFIATPAAVLAAQGVPVICEVDESLNMDPEDFRRKITPYTKAVIPVHMRGVPARMDEILAIAKAAGIKVVEDVAQANGGMYRGRMLGLDGRHRRFQPPAVQGHHRRRGRDGRHRRRDGFRPRPDAARRRRPILAGQRQRRHIRRRELPDQRACRRRGAGAVRPDAQHPRSASRDEAHGSPLD